VGRAIPLTAGDKSAIGSFSRILKTVNIAEIKGAYERLN